MVAAAAMMQVLISTALEVEKVSMMVYRLELRAVQVSVWCDCGWQIENEETDLNMET